MTNIFNGAILLTNSGTNPKITTYGGMTMFIYDMLNDFEERNEEIGVNALSYIVLDCAR